MTLDEKKSLLALMIGDIEGSPYYPLFTDEQYGQFLAMTGGNLNSAVVSAAISASMIVGSEYTREVIGDLQLSSATGSNYLKALDYLIKNTNKSPPPNLMPWIAGLDNPCNGNKLLDFNRCDDGCGDRRKEPMAPEYEQWVKDLSNKLDETDKVVDNTSKEVGLIGLELDLLDELTAAQGQAIVENRSIIDSTLESINELEAVDTTQQTAISSNARDIGSLNKKTDNLELEDLYTPYEVIPDGNA